MSTAAELEALTQDYGREIFGRLTRNGPLLFTPRWWDDRLMGWSMRDEAVKVQLFRFVDVLPMLRSPAAIVGHLREYFAEAGNGVPGWLRLGLRLLPSRGLLGRLTARTAYASAERLARRFIAGSNINEALRAIAALRRRKLAFTVDLLGEATITESEAEASQREYLSLVTELSQEVNAWPEVPLIDRDDTGPLPRVNVSVKLSALYSQFDAMDPEGTSRVIRARLRPLLREARRNRAFVNFDMEQYSAKHMTLQIFREILDEDEFRDWPDVGIAIQAYLRDTEEDLKHLAAWTEKRGTSVWVRLVKGAYWDYETIFAHEQGWPVPVFEQKPETDTTYERCTAFLMRNHHLLRPALGSHNVRSLAHGLALAQHLNLPKGRCEIQMLYGMAEPIKDALVSLKQRVRVYTPYGQLIPGMAYLVRRLLENTSDDSFLRASFTEHVPEEQLLMNPLKKMMNDEYRMMNERRKTAAAHSSFIIHHSSFRNEPVTDFSKEEGRRAMQAALDQVRGQLGRTYTAVINNQAVHAEATVDSLDPSHLRQVVGRWGRATVEHAKQALAAAESAFFAWRDTDPGERAMYLERAAEVMRRRRFELAAWEVYECGKQWRESDADVAEAIDFCNYYAQEMRRLAVPRHRDVPGEENVYFYEPRGVTIVLAPWNFPLAILTGMTTAAIVTGNTVVMKPAEQSSVVAAKLMEVLQEVGLPPGVVNFLPGVGEEVGPALVNDPRTAMIAFTGSREVGLLIYRQAAETLREQHHVKHVLTEMGGKNAILVDADADLDEAVQGVRSSAFGYQGQKCSACSRVIVLEGAYEPFVPRLVEATRSLKIAPAEDPGCAVGPVIDEDAFKRILAAIERGKQEGRLLFAGDVGSLAGEGYYIGPHIFADVDPSASLAQEEIFGPVLAVLKARDLDHALDIANGTPYALTGGFYSRSPANIEKVKQRFRVGNLYINRKITGALVDRQPFGGFKLSGIGYKAGGPDYLLQFMIARTVTENTLRRGFAPGGTAAPPAGE
ncbi:MAG: L-glutamate gamma-semialdehyde dehydrogenase [Planctomycetes bacterium]|nr:L-glutamate gamma-semialdehyde dehydrogenase [Planctomycetota bacterium]